MRTIGKERWKRKNREICIGGEGEVTAASGGSS